MELIVGLVIVYLVLSSTVYQTISDGKGKYKLVGYLPILNIVYLTRYVYDLFNGYKLRLPYDIGDGIYRNAEFRKIQYERLRKRFSIVYTVIFIIMVIPYLLYSLLGKDFGMPDYVFYVFIAINNVLMGAGILNVYIRKIIRGGDANWE